MLKIKINQRNRRRRTDFGMRATSELARIFCVGEKSSRDLIEANPNRPVGGRVPWGENYPSTVKKSFFFLNLVYPKPKFRVKIPVKMIGTHRSYMSSFLCTSWVNVLILAI